MLYALGPVLFEVWPVNVYEVTRATEAGFVEKPVLGRRPPLEFVGDGRESISLAVKLFPEKLGGLSSLDQLDAMRQSGQPQYLMRGDGVPLGWFLLDKVSEKSTFLGPAGIGRVIDVDLGLSRADAPSASDYFAVIAGVLG